MKFRLFIKDKSLLLILQVVCMALLYGFLRVTGYGDTNSILILCVWTLILTVYVAALYVRRRKYFQQLQRILDQVDKRYLLGELMPDSYRLEDRLYQEMIRSSNKSVIECIHQMEQSQKEYREYMESWVHEIKAPITGISLLCENDVDMVLYYARSEHVYKDYLIQPTNLQEAAYEVLEKIGLYLCKNLCRQLGIEIRAESEYGRGMCIELHFPINNYIEETREIRKA